MKKYLFAFEDKTNYEVSIYNNMTFSDADFTKLTIQRVDKEAVRNWEHLQMIKSYVFGENSLGIEIYPPDKFVLNFAHVYHIWVTNDYKNLKMPFLLKTENFHPASVKKRNKIIEVKEIS